MARMMGRMGSWLWWLMGLLCAFVLGARARAGEAKPVYGMPGPAPVPEGKTDPAQTRDKIDKLIDEWLTADLAPAQPSAEDQAKIDGFIKDLGSKDFATREAASAGLIKIGKPALGALKTAAESKDPEVAWRSKAAIEKIGEGPAVEGLRAQGWLAIKAVNERSEKERQAMIKASAAAGEAEAAGKKDEAEKLRAEAKTAQARAEALARLSKRLASSGLTHEREMIAPGPHTTEMAPIRPAPPDPPPPPPNLRK